MKRRDFVKTIALTSALFASQIAQAKVKNNTNMNSILPKKLVEGNTIGIISPAGAVFERESYSIAIESLQAMGLKVKEGSALRNRYGHLAGTDNDRAKELNEMFADSSVDAIICLRGGSGCNRILGKIDYENIKKNPKIFAGFSDITALLNAIYQQTALVTFHAPTATSSWNKFSYNYFRKVLFEKDAVLFENPKIKGDYLTQTKDRIITIRSGKAKGVLLGGNLAVLTSILGSPYAPDFKGKILFLEEINEEIYRVDRMMSQLEICGVFKQVSGVVLGKFTNCKASGSYGTLTLDEIFDDYLKNLNIPVFSGAMIGHIEEKFTIPVGIEAEIDADLGTIKMLRPAVK